MLRTISPNLTSYYYAYGALAVADLDGDGNKDILTCASKETSPYEGKIYAIKKDGTLINSWGAATQTIPHENNFLGLEISVGDLDNDGKLEVVALGYSDGGIKILVGKPIFER